MKKLLREVIDSSNDLSSKRFITLIIAGHFIVSAFVFLIACFWVIFHIPKGQVDLSLLNSLLKIIDDDFYIIIVGLGFITAEQGANILIKKIEKNFGIKDDKKEDS